MEYRPVNICGHQLLFCKFKICGRIVKTYAMNLYPPWSAVYRIAESIKRVTVTGSYRIDRNGTVCGSVMGQLPRAAIRVNSNRTTGFKLRLVTALLKTRQAPSLFHHSRNGDESNSNSGRWIVILFYGHILVAQMKIRTGTHQSSSTLRIRYSTIRERPTDGLCDDVDNIVDLKSE
jgi:hypothetical protein